MPASARGQRCAKHGLAAGPNGLCAICRRESLPPARSPAAWSLGVMLAVLVVVCAGTIVYRVARDVQRPTAAIASEPARERAPDVEASVVESDVPAPAAPAFPDPVAAPPAPAPLPTPPPPAQLTAAASAEAPPTPQKPEPSEAELRQALARTPVVMYATSWCGVCRKARAFMSDAGLTYREVDADATPGAWDEVERLIGKRAVPVVVVDGEVVAGLNAQRILDAAARSMERRLGVNGIAFRAN